MSNTLCGLLVPIGGHLISIAHTLERSAKQDSRKAAVLFKIVRLRLQ